MTRALRARRFETSAQKRAAATGTWPFNQTHDKTLEPHCRTRDTDFDADGDGSRLVRMCALARVMFATGHPCRRAGDGLLKKYSPTELENARTRKDLC